MHVKDVVCDQITTLCIHYWLLYSYYLFVAPYSRETGVCVCRLLFLLHCFIGEAASWTKY